MLSRAAAGFIGSNIVAALNEQGRDDLVVCDHLGQDLRWQNLRKRTFRDFIPPNQLLEQLGRNPAAGDFSPRRQLFDDYNRRRGADARQF